MLLFELESTGATAIVLGLRRRVAEMDDMEVRLDAASDTVYETTRAWFDSRGEGKWPELAESTLRGKRRHRYPEDPLVMTGALRDSATSPHGKYSFRLHPGIDDVVMGIDWERGGWQIPAVHFYGTHTAGRDHTTTIPPRPIWPSHDSALYMEMRLKLRDLMFHGI